MEAIPGTPLPHGILGACSTVTDVTDPHDLLGVEWLALGCNPVRDTDWCPPGNPPPAVAPKEFDRPETEAAAPLTVYTGAECSAPGWTYEEAVEHALANLALGEQAGVEAAFMRTFLAPNADDLTPAEGPVSVAQGVAALEGCLGERYGGAGTLHIPTGAAALLGCCNIAHEDPATGALRTLTGNCVVIGAGYSALNIGPDGLPADPGTAWLYATGPLVIRRGPVDVIPDRNASVNIRTNDRRVLAERTYVVGTTCAVCAINVTVCP
ncbi:cupin [Streptomyces sp. H27-H5]|uniref:cupin n=1 Tax=Streptomyces sp. H27-H5 TaxID=2996460 RepID=UPI0022703300|nr:cupin [Streptomyces sp. H27-H5]MCY0957735.1 cupin [Streptomyces sp. H27-H5]